ncbi:MAG: cytochrome P450 [Actinobacteria bacterium]|nr:cytochrome P450 [Actinomycetota bacterium]MBV9935450.1 cytochrome P450 [Actinomycetota bacterium]
MAIGEFAFNLFDDEVRRDPYPWYDKLRGVGRVVRNPALFGTLMVHRHADVLAILRDPARFSSADPGGMQDRPRVFNGVPTMLTSDPPVHERLRGVLSRAFTPRTVARLEPRLREIARGLVDPLQDGAVVDACDALAAPLPVIAIAELMGVSASDRDSFRQWSDDLIGGTPELATPEAVDRAREAGENLRAYFRAEIARRRASAVATDDLVGRLVAANEGDVLDDDELLASCVLLLVAGNETTTNLIANMTLALARQIDQRRRLVVDPTMVPGAVEEAVRYDAPVQATVRTAKTAVEVGGETINEGERVFVLLAAANRDPDEFPDPDRFDVGRGSTTHLGFGHGVHFCLGAGLARLEARVACEALLAVAPEFSLADPSAVLDYGPSFIFHRPLHVPIVA